MKVYSVFDKKSQLYGPLMTCRTEVEAVRNFERACIDERSPMNAYPQDFDLMLICEFSDENGIISLNTPPAPKFVAAASDYLTEE